MPHFKVAEGILRTVQERAQANGIVLDIGEFPGAEDLGVVNSNEDPQQIVKLTAHLVARIADRFPLSRKLSRHMEGENKRAGLLSDTLAVVFTLYKRNPDAAGKLAQSFARELKAKRQERQQGQEASPNGTTQRVQVTHFPQSQPTGGHHAS